MNIIVIGANGLLGRHLVNNLSKDHFVYCFVNINSIIKFNINDNVKVIKMDLNDFKIDILPKSIDTIFYLAQSNNYKNFPDRSNDIFNVNINAPIEFIDWGRKNGVKNFIYTSSGGIYESSDLPLEESANISFQERDLGFYISTKFCAEILLMNYSKFFKNLSIIRPFFIYGPGQKKSMLISRLINSVKNGDKINLNGKNGITLNPIYVSDAAKAIEKSINLNEFNIINIAGFESLTIRDICKKIAHFLDKEPNFDIKKEKGRNIIANIDKMKKLLISPSTNFDKGIKKTIDFENTPSAK